MSVRLTVRSPSDSEKAKKNKEEFHGEDSSTGEWRKRIVTDDLARRPGPAQLVRNCMHELDLLYRGLRHPLNADQVPNWSIETGLAITWQ